MLPRHSDFSRVAGERRNSKSNPNHIAEEWERQVQERQIARDRLQAEAAMEILNRWSVQQTVRRLRQTSGGQGSSRQGESASVASMTSSLASTSASTIHSLSTIQEVLRSRQARTSRTATADLQATRDAFQTQRQHFQHWFANNNLGARYGPQTEQWYTLWAKQQLCLSGEPVGWAANRT